MANVRAYVDACIRVRAPTLLYVRVFVGGWVCMCVFVCGWVCGCVRVHTHTPVDVYDVDGYVYVCIRTHRIQGGVALPRSQSLPCARPALALRGTVWATGPLGEEPNPF